MASDNDASCKDDPNFAVICGFLQKFGTLCGLDNIDFVDLQNMIENTEQVPQQIIDIHVKLMRRISKNVPIEKWERVLAKICHTYSYQDGWEIERFGYKKAKLTVKLRTLKNLMEMQFDSNVKFKNEINKISAQELRWRPIGHDKLGNAYWYQIDEDCQIRVYKEDPDEETWALVAKDRDGLNSLITQLTENDTVTTAVDTITNEDSNSLELEKPVLDTGQSNHNSTSSTSNNTMDDDSVSKGPIKYSDNSEASTAVSDKVNVAKAATTETSAGSVVSGDSESSEQSDEEVDEEEDEEEGDEEEESSEEDMELEEAAASPVKRPPQIRLKPLKPEPQPPAVKLPQVTGVKSKYMRNELPASGARKAVDSAVFDISTTKRALKRPVDDMEIEEPGSYEKQPRITRPTLLGGNKLQKPYMRTQPVDADDEDDDDTDDDDDEEDESDEDDDDESDEVSDEIEDPVVIVRGHGSGRDNNCGNVRDTPMTTDPVEDDEESPIIGETIEEEVMYFHGVGNGVECDTGNDDDDSDTNRDTSCSGKRTDGVISNSDDKNGSCGVQPETSAQFFFGPNAKSGLSMFASSASESQMKSKNCSENDDDDEAESRKSSVQTTNTNFENNIIESSIESADERPESAAVNDSGALSNIDHQDLSTKDGNAKLLVDYDDSSNSSDTKEVESEDKSNCPDDGATNYMTEKQDDVIDRVLITDPINLITTEPKDSKATEIYLSSDDCVTESSIKPDGDNVEQIETNTVASNIDDMTVEKSPDSALSNANIDDLSIPIDPENIVDISNKEVMHKIFDESRSNDVEIRPSKLNDCKISHEDMSDSTKLQDHENKADDLHSEVATEGMSKNLDATNEQRIQSTITAEDCISEESISVKSTPLDQIVVTVKNVDTESNIAGQQIHDESGESTAETDKLDFLNKKSILEQSHIDSDVIVSDPIESDVVKQSTSKIVKIESETREIKEDIAIQCTHDLKPITRESCNQESLQMDDEIAGKHDKTVEAEQDTIKSVDDGRLDENIIEDREMQACEDDNEAVKKLSNDFSDKIVTIENESIPMEYTTDKIIHLPASEDLCQNKLPDNDGKHKSVQSEPEANIAISQEVTENRMTYEENALAECIDENKSNEVSNKISENVSDVNDTELQSDEMIKEISESSCETKQSDNNLSKLLECNSETPHRTNTNNEISTEEENSPLQNTISIDAKNETQQSISENKISELSADGDTNEMQENVSENITEEVSIHPDDDIPTSASSEAYSGLESIPVNKQSIEDTPNSLDHNKEIASDVLLVDTVDEIESVLTEEGAADFVGDSTDQNSECFSTEQSVSKIADLIPGSKPWEEDFNSSEVNNEALGNRPEIEHVGDAHERASTELLENKLSVNAACEPAECSSELITSTEVIHENLEDTGDNLPQEDLDKSSIDDAKSALSSKKAAELDARQDKTYDNVEQEMENMFETTCAQGQTLGESPMDTKDNDLLVTLENEEINLKVVQTDNAQFDCQDTISPSLFAGETEPAVRVDKYTKIDTISESKESVNTLGIVKTNSADNSYEICNPFDPIIEGKHEALTSTESVTKKYSETSKPDLSTIDRSHAPSIAENDIILSVQEELSDIKYPKSSDDDSDDDNLVIESECVKEDEVSVADDDSREDIVEQSDPKDDDVKCEFDNSKSVQEEFCAGAAVLSVHPDDIEIQHSKSKDDIQAVKVDECVTLDTSKNTDPIDLISKVCKSNESTSLPNDVTCNIAINLTTTCDNATETPEPVFVEPAGQNLNEPSLNESISDTNVNKPNVGEIPSTISDANRLPESSLGSEDSSSQVVEFDSSSIQTEESNPVCEVQPKLVQPIKYSLSEPLETNFQGLFPKEPMSISAFNESGSNFKATSVPNIVPECFHNKSKPSFTERSEPKLCSESDSNTKMERDLNKIEPGTKLETDSLQTSNLIEIYNVQSNSDVGISQVSDTKQDSVNEKTVKVNCSQARKSSTEIKEFPTLTPTVSEPEKPIVFEEPTELQTSELKNTGSCIGEDIQTIPRLNLTQSVDTENDSQDATCSSDIEDESTTQDTDITLDQDSESNPPVLNTAELLNTIPVQSPNVAINIPSHELMHANPNTASVSFITAVPPPENDVVNLDLPLTSAIMTTLAPKYEEGYDNPPLLEPYYRAKSEQPPASIPELDLSCAPPTILNLDGPLNKTEPVEQPTIMDLSAMPSSAKSAVAVAESNAFTELAPKEEAYLSKSTNPPVTVQAESKTFTELAPITKVKLAKSTKPLDAVEAQSKTFSELTTNNEVDLVKSLKPAESETFIDSTMKNEVKLQPAVTGQAEFVKFTELATKNELEKHASTVQIESNRTFPKITLKKDVDLLKSAKSASPVRTESKKTFSELAPKNAGDMLKSVESCIVSNAEAEDPLSARDAHITLKPKPVIKEPICTKTEVTDLTGDTSEDDDPVADIANYCDSFSEKEDESFSEPEVVPTAKKDAKKILLLPQKSVKTSQKSIVDLEDVENEVMSHVVEKFAKKESKSKPNTNLATFSMDFNDDSSDATSSSLIPNEITTRLRSRGKKDVVIVEPKPSTKKIKTPSKINKPEVVDEETKEEVVEEAKVEVKPSKPKAKRKRTLMGLDIPDESTAVEITGVRQSRRIAQIKIKEEAEKRKIEELTIAQIKVESKKMYAKSTALAPIKAAADRNKKHHVVESDDDDDEEYVEQTDDSEEEKQALRKKQRVHKNPKFDEHNPWKSSSDSSSSGGEEEEEEIAEYSDPEDKVQELRSDHEFSPESDLEDEDYKPMRRARTVRKEDAAVEEDVDDTCCQKCGKSDHPEWILLCDKCDNGWHCSCLRPSLMVIPEGDWFCPPCQHATLLTSLQAHLVELDVKLGKREIQVRRKERLAYVGISLNNVLQQEKADKVEKARADSDDSGSSNSSGSESGSSSDSEDSDEPIYRLRQRRQAHSYRFNDYDDLINSAIQEVGGPPIPAGNQGRGKDINTIVQAEKEEESKATDTAGAVESNDKENRVDTAKASDDEDEVLKAVKKIQGKKKKRKLNTLDLSSADDDSDESFKGSLSGDDDDDEYFDDNLSESSGSYVGKRRKGGVRRSTRARSSRWDKDFINDDSDDDGGRAGPRKKSKWGDETDDESDLSEVSWGSGARRKRNRIRKSGGGGGSKSKSKKKKRRSKALDSDGDDDMPVKKKRRKIQFGGLNDSDEEEEESKSSKAAALSSVRRTRGRRVTYVDALGTDSEEELRRRKVVLPEESEEEYCVDEDDELQDEDGNMIEKDSDDSNAPVAHKILKPVIKKGKGKGGIKRIKRAQGIEEELFPPLKKPDDTTSADDKKPNDTAQSDAAAGTVETLTTAPSVLPAAAGAAASETTTIVNQFGATSLDPTTSSLTVIDPMKIMDSDPIAEINRNIEAMDEKQMEMLMEEEEYANKQLQMVAIQLEREKKRKELELQMAASAASATVAPSVAATASTVPPPLGVDIAPISELPTGHHDIPAVSPILGSDPVTPKKRGRKPKALTPTPPGVLPPVGPAPAGSATMPAGESPDMLPLHIANMDGGGFNADGSPKKRRGRGKGKKTLEKEAAAAVALAAAVQQFAAEPLEAPARSTSEMISPAGATVPGVAVTPPGGPGPIAGMPKQQHSPLMDAGGLSGGKLGIATAPQPFSQSQPTPSVITRMLQSPHGPVNYPPQGAQGAPGKYYGSPDMPMGATGGALPPMMGSSPPGLPPRLRGPPGVDAPHAAYRGMPPMEGGPMGGMIPAAMNHYQGGGGGRGPPLQQLIQQQQRMRAATGPGGPPVAGLPPHLYHHPGSSSGGAPHHHPPISRHLLVPTTGARGSSTMVDRISPGAVPQGPPPPLHQQQHKPHPDSLPPTTAASHHPMASPLQAASAGAAPPPPHQQQHLPAYIRPPPAMSSRYPPPPPLRHVMPQAVPSRHPNLPPTAAYHHPQQPPQQHHNPGGYYGSYGPPHSHLHGIPPPSQQHGPPKHGAGSIPQQQQSHLAGALQGLPPGIHVTPIHPPMMAPDPDLRNKAAPPPYLHRNPVVVSSDQPVSTTSQTAAPPNSASFPPPASTAPQTTAPANPVTVITVPSVPVISAPLAPTDPVAQITVSSTTSKSDSAASDDVPTVTNTTASDASALRPIMTSSSPPLATTTISNSSREPATSDKSADDTSTVSTLAPVAVTVTPPSTVGTDSHGMGHPLLTALGAPSDGSSPKLSTGADAVDAAPYEEEPSEFGGLVSYFSSQREDDLDT